MKPCQFWYERVGFPISDQPYDPVAGPDYTLNAMYDNLNPEKGRLRIGGGGGTYCLITPGRAWLRANIVPVKPLPSHLTLFAQSEKTPNQWLVEIWTAPPEAPYLMVELGKASFTSANFRYSTGDVLNICGKTTSVYDLRAIRRGVAAFEDVDGAKLFEAAMVQQSLQVAPNTATNYRKLQLEKIGNKIPDLHARLQSLPPISTPEFEAVRIVFHVRKRAEKEQDHAAA